MDYAAPCAWGCAFRCGQQFCGANLTFAALCILVQAVFLQAFWMVQHEAISHLYPQTQQGERALCSLRGGGHFICGLELASRSLTWRDQHTSHVGRKEIWGSEWGWAKGGGGGGGLFWRPVWEIQQTGPSGLVSLVSSPSRREDADQSGPATIFVHFWTFWTRQNPEQGLLSLQGAGASDPVDHGEDCSGRVPRFFAPSTGRLV